MEHTPAQWGELIARTRKRMGVSQASLAMTAGTGVRFIVDLEKGKPTCELGKALTVLRTLGISVDLTPPVVEDPRESAAEREAS